MPSKELICIILAAGKGTRLKSETAKVLHRAGGRTLVEHVLAACQPLGGELLTVVGHQAESVAAAVMPFKSKTVLQRPQNGTGHAMLIARSAIGSKARLALVVPGDAPLVRTETLTTLLETHRQGDAAATVLTAELDDPTGYGRIVRKKDLSVAAIVEEKSASDAQRKIHEVNSGVYCFSLEYLWPALQKVRPENAHHELYLTDAITELNRIGERVLPANAANAREILGCNTRAELAEADRIFRARKAAQLMDAGVTIYLPETVLIDPEVQVESDSVIEPGVQLLGKTRIGSHCRIQSGSVLTDSTLEHHVLVRQYSVITGSSLSVGAIVGPFARLREGSELLAGARVGNFVEVKKSIIGEGAKAMHLSYLGDSTVGRESNIGAGTITCNYDGVKKSPTTIGERVFVGSDSALVAPVRIGNRAYIAAGSTITDDVPPDALAIARGRQVNKEGWAAERLRKIEEAASVDARSIRQNSRDDRSAEKSKSRTVVRKSRARKRNFRS